MIKILAVDDDADILNSIDVFLTNEGFEIFKARNGLEAIEILKKEEVQLVLMDLMMPKMDGIAATLAIRKERGVPIIMLTAKSEDADVVLGLNIGADDYITKPFNFLELIARVKSNLRRYMTYDNYKKEEDAAINIRGLRLDKKTMEVSVNERLVRLTPIEFKILRFLMENKGATLSIKQIYENVWEEEFYNSENTVAVHIRRIREKIEANPKNPVYLKVVWGVGYKIEK
jgi:DNA-binding response OmpR family regulator